MDEKKYLNQWVEFISNNGDKLIGKVITTLPEAGFEGEDKVIITAEDKISHYIDVKKIKKFIPERDESVAIKTFELNDGEEEGKIKFKKTRKKKK